MSTPRPPLPMAGPGRLASIVLLAVALLSPAVLADATTEPKAVSLPATPAVLALKAIGWQSLEYSRSNIWASVSSRIVLHEVPAAALERRPLFDAEAVAGEALTPAGGRLLLLQAENQAASNRERLSSWFDPSANTLLQRCRVAYGRSDSRAQCYLYEDAAVWRERRERGGNGGPDEPEWVQGGAKTAAVPDWPVSSRVELARPAAIPADAGLTSPMLLLPLASAAPLEQTGDSQTVFVHTDHDFYRVTLRLKGRETIDVEYRLTAADGAIRKVVGQARTLVVALEAHAVGAARDEFTLLGMSGSLQLLLDPATRVPLAIRGNAPWIGQTELRLDGASLVE